MAYTHHVEFTIRSDQMEELRIGSSLAKVIGYLRTMLPNEPGFIHARGMHSLDTPGATHIVVESTWDQWEDLEAHRAAGLAEQKVLTEFGSHIGTENLTVHLYEDVP